METTTLPPCAMTASVGPNWQCVAAFSVGYDEPTTLADILETQLDRDELERAGVSLQLEDLSHLKLPGEHAVLRPVRPEQRLLIFSRLIHHFEEIGFWAVEAATWLSTAREHGGLIVEEERGNSFMFAEDGKLRVAGDMTPARNVWLVDAVVFPRTALKGLITELLYLNEEFPEEVFHLKIPPNGLLQTVPAQGGSL